MGGQEETWRGPTAGKRQSRNSKPGPVLLQHTALYSCLVLIPWPHWASVVSTAFQSSCRTASAIIHMQAMPHFCCCFQYSQGPRPEEATATQLPCRSLAPLVEALHTFKSFLNPDSELGLVRELGSCRGGGGGGQGEGNGGADWFLLSESSGKKSDTSIPQTQYICAGQSLCVLICKTGIK